MFARTDRLLLRPGWIEDAPALAAAIADPAIARMTRRIPHPYALADAEAHIARQHGTMLPDLLVFARTHGAPRLVGGVGMVEAGAGRAALGYWIARPYWGLGYATEAAAAVIDMGFSSLRLQGLIAEHFADNPASGRVLRKLGFQPTGLRAERGSVARRGTAPCLQYRLAAEAWGQDAEEPLAA